MAHKLLRHLRNAAHGKITNEKRKKKILSDYNENKRPTMRGKISNILLYGLISLLYKPFNIVISFFKKWYLLGKTSLLWINKQY